MNFLKRLFSRREENYGFNDLFDPSQNEELLNPELQAAIKAVEENNTSTNRQAVFKILLEITFCLPSSGSDDGTAEVSSTLNDAGEMCLVVFSDPVALRRWENNPESMLVMPATQMFEVAIQNDFAEIHINPAGPAGGKLMRHEFMRMTQGVLPE